MVVQVSYWTRFAREAYVGSRPKVPAKKSMSKNVAAVIDVRDNLAFSFHRSSLRTNTPRSHNTHVQREWPRYGTQIIPDVRHLVAIPRRLLFTLPQLRRYPRQWSNDDKNKKTNSYPVLERCSVRPEEESNGGERDFIRVEGNWNL